MLTCFTTNLSHSQYELHTTYHRSCKYALTSHPIYDPHRRHPHIHPHRSIFISPISALPALPSRLRLHPDRTPPYVLYLPTSPSRAMPSRAHYRCPPAYIAHAPHPWIDSEPPPLRYDDRARCTAGPTCQRSAALVQGTQPRGARGKLTEGLRVRRSCVGYPAGRAIYSGAPPRLSSHVGVEGRRRESASCARRGRSWVDG